VERSSYPIYPADRSNAKKRWPDYSTLHNTPLTLKIIYQTW
jgi:hypothetical protein